MSQNLVSEVKFLRYYRNIKGTEWSDGTALIVNIEGSYMERKMNASS